MPKLSTETIDKLEWLKGRLRKYPHRYDQSSACGTQACLYGFCAPRIHGIRTVTLSEAAAEHIDCMEQDLADWLAVPFSSAALLFAPFWAGDAVIDFNRRWSDTNERAAEKACQRIDLFIESGGKK